MQSLFELQLVLQEVTPQLYGEQLDVAWAGHVPFPEQLAGAV